MIALKKVVVISMLILLLLPVTVVAIPDNIPAPPPPKCGTLTPVMIQYLISQFPGNPDALNSLIANYESICETSVP